MAPKLKRQKSSGSVKRARERAAAGFSSSGRDQLEPAPLRVTSNRTPPRATTPSEQTYHTSLQPSEPSPSFSLYPSRSQHIPSPSTSSTVTPTTPSWQPVPDPAVRRVRSHSPVQESRTPRGPPPKRPPRPDYVPPLPNQTSGQQSGNCWEPDFNPSPGGNSKTLGNPSRSVTATSSLGVPEFSTPLATQTPYQPRRNLGPPPSARKGGANFYPQNAFVAPIPEEQSETHSSFASSHVIPASWGDGPPEYYMGSGISEEDEDGLHSPSSTNDGRDTRVGDHDESTGLVRKVSIGKPGKPALKSVRSEGAADEHPRAGQEVQFGPGAGLPTFLAPSSNTNSPEGSPGDQWVDYKEKAGYPRSGTASPTPAVDPRVAEILSGLERGGALSTAATTPKTSTTLLMSDRGGKRPARLKLAGAYESEPRGSVTSLPELIRRATRLASNLDRGRTASRMSTLEMLEKEKSKHPSRPGSISDILAAFPSPSLATPQAHSPRFPSPPARSGLHNNYTVVTDPSDYSGQHRGRRCCGLPIWAFILVCIILLLLVAAAVIIPVTLIVLPRQNSNSAVGTVAGCRKSSPCANGGIPVLKANSCRCICANGFNGATCTSPPDSGCTMTNIEANDKSDTVYKNVTVGTSIDRLLTSGNTVYSIPLDSSVLLSLFSSHNLTCSSENALVTFDGQPQRKRGWTSSSLLDLGHLKKDKLSNPRHPTRASLLDARALANRAIPAQAAITSNGLVYAAPPGAPSPGSSSPSASASSSPSQSTSPSSTIGTSSSEPASLPLTSTILDFARTAILFIFQERDLGAAVSAQENIQAVFSPAASGGSFNASVKDVGAGIKIDWVKLSVDFGNGTDFGGRGEDLSKTRG
ncbi:MAG: hypothetical protein Q9196_002075 [Gyalolechia fulgens]